MIYPECYPLWLEAEINGSWTTDHGAVAGVRSFEEADERVQDLQARGVRATGFRLVNPAGLVVSEGRRPSADVCTPARKG